MKGVFLMEKIQLREQFIRDMEIKGFAETTIRSYVGCVVVYAKRYKVSPELLGEAEIREHLHYLVKENKSKGYINQAYSSLKFLYETTLKRDWEGYKIPRSKQSKRLAVALTEKEIYTLITEIKNLKHKAIFSVMYSGGLRVSEVLNLKTIDINSETMSIYVSDGKGSKDRYTILSRTALQDLRNYCKAYKIRDSYLFPGAKPGKPLTSRSVQAVFRNVKELKKLNPRATVHSVRHSFATHMLESGISVHHLQKLLGHSQIKTTAKYLHISNVSALKLVSVQDIYFESRRSHEDEYR